MDAVAAAVHWSATASPSPKAGRDRIASTGLEAAVQGVLGTFRYGYQPKAAYEYAKALYHAGLAEEARVVASGLMDEVCMDWRTVYRTYHLLARIHLDRGQVDQARDFARLSLRANERFAPARDILQQTGKSDQEGEE